MYMFDQLKIAFLAHFSAWYPVIAVALMACVQVLKMPKLRDYLWSHIPDGAKMLVPILGPVVYAIIQCYQSGADATTAFGVLMAALFGMSFPAMGIHAALRESPLPFDGGAGGKPKPEATVIP